MSSRKPRFIVISLIAALTLILSACATPTPETIVVTAPPVTVKETVEVEATVEVPVEVTSTPEPERVIKVFGAYATPLEEPWDNV
ncbi:MAG TPA: hypothetical protein VI547_14615, partial [Anaerolineales bacterium]|nr:hypothetical protein [Anaerolineales bacterium]